ncbi:MAG: MGMT family protein [Candidatus Methylomirabilota bacterium]
MRARSVPAVERRSGFFERVYAIVRRIPRGRVASYGQIARLAGASRHARVVGWAMHGTPKGAGIPWHRVLQQGGGLSPAVSPREPGRQRRLLEAEGVVFRLDGRVDLAAHQWVPAADPPPRPRNPRRQIGLDGRRRVQYELKGSIVIQSEIPGQREQGNDGGVPPMNGGQVYAALERQIIQGALQPRERLVEADLCRKLGVSRTLLREVLRRLEGVGLVVLSPNRGAVVRDFGPEEIEDLYVVRLVLERAVAERIVERITPGDLRELRALNREFEAACRHETMADMIWTNIAFHRRMSAVSGSPFLCQFLDISRLQTNQIRYLVWANRRRIRESRRDHRDMLAALSRKDRTAFEMALFRHVAGGKRDYQEIYLRQRTGTPGDGSARGAPADRSGHGRRTPARTLSVSR